VRKQGKIKKGRSGLRSPLVRRNDYKARRSLRINELEHAAFNIMLKSILVIQEHLLRGVRSRG